MLISLDGVQPRLDASAWVHASAQLIGDVQLAAGASAWCNVVLRGDGYWIRIGARSNIQESCTLHTDMGSPLTIGEDCTIGHNVVLHGCTIGEGSLIGMGSIVLNRARIGRGSLVGAGALITEDKSFDDFSLIMGSPAKAIRLLEKDAVAALRFSAAHYVENWRRFAKGLKPIEP